MNRLVLVVILAVSTWTCGGSPVSPTSSSAPPAPATPSAPAPQLTYVLSGVVFEVTPTGVMPIQDIQVEEYGRHQFATTDVNGFYRLSGLSAGQLGIGFEKEGYRSNRSTVTVNGDTRFDIQAIRR